MVDFRYKPNWLPQVSAPFSIVLNKLNDEGVKCKMYNIDPNELEPSQGIVLSDKIGSIDPQNIKPIWIANDKKVLDGHHRYARSLQEGTPIKVIEISLNSADAIRVLNKIQDIHEYEMKVTTNEVVAQDQINAMNDPSFLDELEDHGKPDIPTDKSIVGNKVKKIKAYRKDDINEKSNVGNFFSAKPIDGFREYDIEFDNLLDTNDIKLAYSKDSNPVETLAKTWFPNIEFDKIAKKFNIPVTAIMNRAVAEKAGKMGYDGIKYGDIMIQGLK